MLCVVYGITSSIFLQNDVDLSWEMSLWYYENYAAILPVLVCNGIGNDRIYDK